MKSKALLGAGILALLIASAAGITYAAFNDKVNFQGSKITIGSAEIKLLNDLAVPPTEANLVDSKTAPNLENVNPLWQQNYALKLYSNASTNLEISSKANYTTALDPDDLRRYILVEIFDWNDVNNDGEAQMAELSTSHGVKNIIDWKNDGFLIGNLASNQTRGLMLQFTAPNIPDDKQGLEGLFDFEFDAEGVL